MSKRSERLPEAAPAAGGGVAARPEVEAFLARVRAAPAEGDGRLIFALDATMSRQPTWDLACSLQAEMFDAAGRAGGLAVQLVYFRGHGEARASRWVSDATALKRLMTGTGCHGGLTQIGRVLGHANRVAATAPLAALVFVGDAMEESADALCHEAGKLALRNTRAFMFHEGGDQRAAAVFREIARLTGGAYLPFDARAASELRALLGAVGAFAAGGRTALEASGSTAARRLLADLRP
jgi:hypothetical protein